VLPLQLAVELQLSSSTSRPTQVRVAAQAEVAHVEQVMKAKSAVR
jgi:hypothetical protein